MGLKDAARAAAGGVRVKQPEPGVTLTPLNKCLNCGYKINAAGTPDGSAGAPPTDGSLAVCLKCGAVMAYAHDLTLRGLTDAEMDEIINERETMDVLAHLVRRIHFIRHGAN